MGLDPATLGSTAKFLEAVHPDDRPLMREMLYGVKAGAVQGVATDARIVRGDGEVRWMMVRAEPRVDENGMVVRLEGTMQDITERKNAEEALRERDSLLRQISESTNEIFWVRDAGKTAFIFMSPGYERVLGTPVSRLLKKPWSWMRQVHGGDRAQMKAALQAAGGDPGKPTPGGEYRIVRPDGEVRWILLSGETVVPDEQGRAYRIVGSAHDITDRRRAEHALRESEQHLRAVVDSSLDGIVLLDDAGRYVEANPAACRMLGYPRDEFLKLAMKDVVPQGDLASFHEGWRKFRELGSFQGRRRLLRRDGTLMEVESHRVANILPGLHLSVLHDVTAAVQAEESRRTLEQQLVEAQKLDAVGRLAGGVAHDFNNLLTVINGYSDLMLSQMEQDDSHRDAVEAIRHAGSRAASLTQQLLAFGRKQRLKAVPLNVNDVLVQASRMLQRLIGEDILVEVRPGRGLGMVKADPSHLEQVVVNLALNARDAMPMGGLLRLETGEVEVREAPEPGCAAGRYVRLRVSDTGVGIAEDMQARIFEPFFTTKKVGKGTGLGLSVVHGVVRQSGGYIRFKSRLGEGSTFDVYLPVVTENPVAEPESMEREAALGGREAILLVEDESAVRDVIATMLRSAGYEVLEASGATEALMQAGKRKIDLLLSDVIMPGMGGPQLAEIMRAHDPGLRVLYVSGYAQDATGERGLLRSGDALLQKPFSPADLLRRVRGVLAADEESRESGWNI
jgi:PAS domain S-box-containing protein